MLRKYVRKSKHFFSQIILGIYLIALFSQAFHSHSSDQVDFSITKVEKKSFSTEKISTHSDCLACHFLATGFYIVADDYHFIVQKDNAETEQVFHVQEKIWSSTKYTFQLRGPPAVS